MPSKNGHGSTTLPSRHFEISTTSMLNFLPVFFRPMGVLSPSLVPVKWPTATT
jgi:hypothetical protein